MSGLRYQVLDRAVFRNQLRDVQSRHVAELGTQQHVVPYVIYTGREPCERQHGGVCRQAELTAVVGGRRSAEKRKWCHGGWRADRARRLAQLSLARPLPPANVTGVTTRVRLARESHLAPVSGPNYQLLARSFSPTPRYCRYARASRCSSLEPRIASVAILQYPMRNMA